MPTSTRFFGRFVNRPYRNQFESMLQIWVYRFVKAMQTNVLISLVLQNLFNVIISSLLLSQRGTREVSILPLSPLGNPPIPLKRLLKRRRAFFHTQLKSEAQNSNDNCRVGACSNRLKSRITEHSWMLPTTHVCNFISQINSNLKI